MYKYSKKITINARMKIWFDNGKEYIPIKFENLFTQKKFHYNLSTPYSREQIVGLNMIITLSMKACILCFTKEFFLQLWAKAVNIAICMLN